MHGDYIAAIETRLRWLRWGQEKGIPLFRDAGFNRISETYVDILGSGDTFFMNAPFAALVDQARRTVPDDLRFDARWLQAKAGWIYLATPFEVPETTLPANEQDGQPVMWVRAVGWHTVPTGAALVGQDGSSAPAEPGTVQFCTFLGRPITEGLTFWPWSYWVLRDGDRLDVRLEEFERKARESNDGGAYVPASERQGHPLHEIRWVFAAMHLMGQRLAMTVPHQTDRATRRRAERNHQIAPPLIKVVTLRRLEADRQRDPKGQAVDWAWSWIVSGHWRNQWYAAEGVHKQIFVESFVKGPPEKPLKPSGLKLFVARR